MPAVFTTLGALYAEKGDSPAARQYFEKALEKDPDYQPAKQNLAVLEHVKPDPPPIVGGREQEPNNDIPHANILPLDTAVAAGISDTSDTDYYRFTTAHAPRDIYQISLKNESTTLEPGLTVYDQQKNQITSDYRSTPGADLDLSFSPMPDTNYYVQVFQHNGTSGAYQLSVRPMHRYDSFEPNDDINSASPLALGKMIDANIMDRADTDFFEIKSGGSPGNLTVSLKNLSTTLEPELNVYDRQKNRIGGDYRSTAGADLDYSFAAQPGTTYYIQVGQHDGTSGNYRLVVR